MSIDEAIKHCEEVAEKNNKIADTFEYSLKTKSDCKECASEHRQLAEWLKELQRWREFGGRIANVCASYITEEQKEKLLEIMEVNSDDIQS